MTATASFIKTAKTPGRLPILSMKVEDISGSEETYTSQADWEGSATLTNIDTTEEPGSVLNERFNFIFNLLDPPAGEIEIINTPWKFVDGDAITVNTAALVVHPVNDSYLNYLNATIGWPAGLGITLKIRALVRDAVEFPTTEFITPEQTITGIAAGFGLSNLSLVGAPIVSAGSTAYVIIQGWDTGSSKWFNLTQQVIIGVDPTTLDYIKPTAQIITSVIDMGFVPAADIIFTVDDIKPSGASVVYSARGSTDNFAASDVDLGIIEDGDTISAFRYYKITADITTTSGARAKIREIVLSVGEFFELSSISGEPTLASRPYIIPKSVKPLTSKIDLMKPATVGQATLSLSWSKFTGDMIFNGRLKNKQVFLKLGYEGLTSEDYEPYFTGIWQEYGADENRRIISVKIEDALKRFRKIKIPIESSDSSDNPTTSNYVVTAINVIQAMLDIIDEIGIPDRFIDRTSFEDIRDNILSSTDWDVTRTIFADNPQDAWELMNELAVIAGCFLIMLPNGKLSIVYYSPLFDPVDTIDANQVKVSPLDGGQKNLFTRQLVRYDPAVADPGDDEADYNKLNLYINATAETEWDLAAERRWFEKWDASPAAVGELTIRMDEWFSNPKTSLTLTGLTMRHINRTPGQIIAIDNLMMPSDELDWPGLTNGRKFLIMGMTIDPVKHAISFDILELGESLRFNPTAYSIVNGGDPSSNTLTNADAIDALVIEVTENAGQQWELEFTFEPTIDCHQVIFYGHYDGSPSHQVYLEAWNYDTLAWDRFTADLTDFPTSDSDYYKVFNFPHPIDQYRDVSSAGNESKVRIRHASNGSNGHFIHVDMLNLRSQG